MGKMLDKLNEYLENATQEELQDTYNKLSHLLCKDNSTIIDKRIAELEDKLDQTSCYEEGFEEGYTAAKKELIDKACKSFCKVRCASTPCTLKCNSIIAFLKAMEG